MADAEIVDAPGASEAPEGESPPAPTPAIVTPEAVKAAEAAALNVHAKINMQAAPIRQYLEAAVVPTLMQGMAALVKERPEDPVAYLAFYLLSNNPHNPRDADKVLAALAATAPAAPVAP